MTAVLKEWLMTAALNCFKRGFGDCCFKLKQGSMSAALKEWLMTAGAALKEQLKTAT